MIRARDRLTSTASHIMNQHAPSPCRRPQRGAVMVMFGLMLVVLIGFAGLAIDLGRFFVIKSELQNAMDACALSAASQLRPGLNTATDHARAVAYGRVFTTGGMGNDNAIKNFANFQNTTVNIAATDITFSAALNGPYTTAGSAGSGYAKCEYPLQNLPIYFMQVLNAALSTQTVSAMAVATGGPQICNVIPAGTCQRNTNPDRGLVVGEWVSIGAKMDPGWFGWVDYAGPAGGTPEVKDGLTAFGQCNLPVIGATAQENGKKTSAENAWNTRFGIYTNPYRISDISEYPPDKTGYGYFGQNVGKSTNPKRLEANWPRSDAFIDDATTPRAYDGTQTTFPYSGNPNFQIATGLRKSYQTEAEEQGARQILSNTAVVASGGIGGQLDLGRMNRRLVVLPILDCNLKPMVIRDLACMLMLNPFGAVSGPGGGPIDGKLEYLGRVGTDITPCGNATVVVAPNPSVLVK